MAASADLMWRAPALRPLAPLVLAAWEDGSLTPHDLLRIREALERGPWLSGEERDDWWQHAVDTWPTYAEYQEKTERLIPLFLLERVEE